LKNRLVSSTGLRVSPTAIFDHPNPVALARHLAATYEAQASDSTADEEPAPAVAPAGSTEDGEAWAQIDGMAVEDLIRMARGDRS
jgi:hypothetical protein